jgi:hypothetical protein
VRPTIEKWIATRKSHGLRASGPLVYRATGIFGQENCADEKWLLLGPESLEGGATRVVEHLQFD